MPTREVLASFWRDWDRLNPQQQRAFREAVARFIADIADEGQSFHPRLRVKRVSRTETGVSSPSRAEEGFDGSPRGTVGQWPEAKRPVIAKLLADGRMEVRGLET